MDIADDRQIIERLKQGNIDAISDIFTIYYRRMYSFAAYMINDRDAAHDVVLDILLKVWENRSTEIRTSFRNYLLTALRNGCINYLNSLNIRDRNDAKWMQAHIVSDTVGFIEDEDLRRNVEALASDLPEQCRKVFSLRVLNGYSYNEIAVILGISENAVKVQLHRAGKKLKKKMADINDIYILLAVIACIVKQY